MQDKKDIGLWLFSLDDRELYRFYSDQKSNKSLYYILYIERSTRDFPIETKSILHLQENTILLIDACLVPIFYRLYLKGYMIIIAEAFCISERDKALLKLFFFHNQPEGIIEIGRINIGQKKCMNALYQEYYSPYDDLQRSILRNLLVNLILLSPEIDYNGLLKSGHLLNHALQFADLINDYAIYEKKKSFYADKINITKKTLDESLNYIYRKSFKELLANWIIIESMKLLVFGDKSISLIAHELGYDTSNFIKFFSRQKGIHPKALRESYREMIKEIENVY